MKMTRYETIAHEVEIPTSIEEFTNWSFSSGPTTGEDFNVFARMFKRWLKKNLPESLQLADFSKGHYGLSGFISKGSKYIYFSLSDVRHFCNWHNDILIRTAEGPKDYTGGSNNSTSLDNLVVDVQKLIS